MMRRTMSMVWLCLCILGSHTVMRQSSPPAARNWPSGLQVRLLTEAASPVNSSVCARRLMRPSLLLKLLSKARGLTPPICLREGPCEGRWQPSSLQKRRSFAPMAFAFTREHCSILPCWCCKQAQPKWPGCILNLYQAPSVSLTQAWSLQRSIAARKWRCKRCSQVRVRSKSCIEVRSATELGRVSHKQRF